MYVWNIGSMDLKPRINKKALHLGEHCGYFCLLVIDRFPN